MRRKSFLWGKLIFALVILVILITAVACPSASTPTGTTTTPPTTTTKAPTSTATASPGATVASPGATASPSRTATASPSVSASATATTSPRPTTSATATATSTAVIPPPVSGSATPSGSPGASVTASPSGSASPGALGSVEVLGVWGSTELASFQAMVAPWEQQTGGKMNFTGTRDLTAVLTTRIQAGNPPDIAILPNPGLAAQFAAAGNLKPLNPMLDMATIQQQYSADIINSGTFNNNLYAIFMKGTNKGTIWYNPGTFTSNGWNIPKTWDELITLSNTIVSQKKTPAAPWSVGVEAAQASGFPATDWIAQIFLTKYGGAAYDQWVKHQIPWTDPRIKDAWSMFGTIVNTQGYVPGGATSALATNFQDASFLPFQSPPKAAMYYEGDFVEGFITAQFPNLKAGTDFDFFQFPSIAGGSASPSGGASPSGSASPSASVSPVAAASPSASPSASAAPSGSPGATSAVGGGIVTFGSDLVVAFKDTPTVRSFVKYLATPEAQTIWVKRGGFTSFNKAVSADAYPDPIARKAAQGLVNASVVRFGAGDVMPGAMQTAWWAATLQYLQNPGQLDSILSNLENTAKTAYSASPTASGAASPSASGAPSAAPSSTSTP